MVGYAIQISSFCFFVINKKILKNSGFKTCPHIYLSKMLLNFTAFLPLTTFSPILLGATDKSFDSPTPTSISASCPLLSSLLIRVSCNRCFVKLSIAFSQSTKEMTQSREEIRLDWTDLFLTRSHPMLGKHWINSVFRIHSRIFSRIGLCRQDSNWVLSPFVKTPAAPQLSSPLPGLKCSLSLTQKPPLPPSRLAPQRRTLCGLSAVWGHLAYRVYSVFSGSALYFCSFIILLIAAVQALHKMNI